jgi:hypothetical protein
MMRGPKLGVALKFECPRCGDSFDCTTQDDLYLATTHRLLHLTGDWKASLRPNAYWSLDEDVSRAVAR